MFCDFKNENLKCVQRPAFTLLETLAALGIFILILFVMSVFVNTIFSSNNIIYNQLSAQKEARAAAENFVKEVRNASASSIGSYVIVGATADSFTFYSDIDFDSYMERVRYFVDGSNFKKGALKPSGNPLTYNPVNETITIIVNDLTAGQQPFLYYDKNYIGIGSALSFPVNVLNIRMAALSLTIDKKQGVSPLPIIISAKTEIRNLKYAE